MQALVYRFAAGPRSTPMGRAAAAGAKKKGEAETSPGPAFGRAATTYSVQAR